MNPTGIPLFDLAEKRLTWSDQRQSLLARNIANANTPGFAPEDLPAFSPAGSTAGSIEPMRTDPLHLAGTWRAFSDLVTSRRQLHGVDKNTVPLDQQLTKIAETETTQALTISIYKKYMSMFSVAAGHSS